MHPDTALSSWQVRCGALDNVTAMPSARVFRSNRNQIYDKNDG